MPSLKRKKKYRVLVQNLLHAKFVQSYKCRAKPAITVVINSLSKKRRCWSRKVMDCDVQMYRSCNTWPLLPVDPHEPIKAAVRKGKMLIKLVARVIPSKGHWRKIHTFNLAIFRTTFYDISSDHTQAHQLLSTLPACIVPQYKQRQQWPQIGLRDTEGN